MNILVTGGAGYIGSHSCKLLAANGYTPVSYDNLENGHEWAVKWGPLEVGDIRDSNRLREVIKKYQPQAVIHFAAYIEVAESVENPAKYFDNNVGGTANLLQVMQQTGVQKIVYSSSCAVYGLPSQVPISETCRIAPKNPYGRTKADAEAILRDYDLNHGIRSISLRYFNAAGADPDGETGEAHDPESHLIPNILKTGALDGGEVVIFGDDYDTPDGTCVRDYIHVTDLAQAHFLSLNRLLSGAGSSVYNLGNGRGYSVREVIESVNKLTGRDFNLQVSPRRPGDVPVLVANAARAAEELDWKTRYSDLNTILDSAWDWIQSRPE